MNSGSHNQQQSANRWSEWIMLVCFIFLGFESALLAVALKGTWFVLLGPALVCTQKALETWRVLMRETPEASGVSATLSRDWN